MSIALPPLPSPRRLKDVCEQIAALERMTPEAVEKDFYLTRLIWAFGQADGAFCFALDALEARAEAGSFRTYGCGHVSD